MNQLVQVSTVCRNESVDTNWFIFRHARRLRNSVWTFANVAQTDASVNQFGTVCTLEQPATILRKSVHALNQFCKNDSSGKTWLRCWNCSRWHELRWLFRVCHVDLCCVDLWHVVASRSMFCQLRVVGRLPLTFDKRVANVWETLPRLRRLHNVKNLNQLYNVGSNWYHLKHRTTRVFYFFVFHMLCNFVMCVGYFPDTFHAWETRSIWRRLHHVWQTCARWCTVCQRGSRWICWF